MPGLEAELMEVSWTQGLIRGLRMIFQRQKMSCMTFFCDYGYSTNIYLAQTEKGQHTNVRIFFSNDSVNKPMSLLELHNVREGYFQNPGEPKGSCTNEMFTSQK